jgi:hypothetical protein
MQLPEVPSTQQKKKGTMLLIIVPRRSLLILSLESVAGRKATNATVCSNDDAVWGVTAADHRFWAEHTAYVSAVKAVIGEYPTRSLILRMPAIVKKPLRESEWSLPFLLESRAKDKAIAAVRAKNMRMALWNLLLQQRTTSPLIHTLRFSPMSLRNSRSK